MTADAAVSKPPERPAVRVTIAQLEVSADHGTNREIVGDAFKLAARPSLRPAGAAGVRVGLRPARRRRRSTPSRWAARS